MVLRASRIEREEGNCRLFVFRCLMIMMMMPFVGGKSIDYRIDPLPHYL